MGCGSGMISKLIPSSLSYVGVDFNSNYLSGSWRGRSVDARTAGSILCLPFRSNSFRTVLLLQVIEHFPQKLQLPLLTEANRVLTPGGTFISSTPNLGTMWNASKFLPPNDPRHIHCLRMNEVTDLLAAAGFKRLTRIGYDIFMAYPSPLARLLPYLLRRSLATMFSALDKHAVFIAVKP